LSLPRRAFVQGLSCAVAAAALGRRASAAAPLPLAFSTLGCPTWPLPRILSFAQENGFAAVELRGLEGNLDLPSHPAFAAASLPETKRAIAAHGLRIACVSSSASLYDADAAKRAQVAAEARRSIDLAAALGAPYVRVFGNSNDEGAPSAPRDELNARVAASLAELGGYAGPRKVAVLLESHDHFTASPVIEDVLTRARSPHVGLLWDAFHTFDSSGEEPEATVKRLRRFIRHTHLKDGAKASGKERKYVLTGRGEVPVQRQVQALRAAGYDGVYCFEWEKVWHPDLEEPEIAIADFARVVGGYLREK
jgi:sugar phosphate isomerase/epimerase